MLADETDTACKKQANCTAICMDIDRNGIESKNKQVLMMSPLTFTKAARAVQ